MFGPIETRKAIEEESVGLTGKVRIESLLTFLWDHICGTSPHTPPLLKLEIFGWSRETENELPIRIGTFFALQKDLVFFVLDVSIWLMYKDLVPSRVFDVFRRKDRPSLAFETQQIGRQSAGPGTFEEVHDGNKRVCLFKIDSLSSTLPQFVIDENGWKEIRELFDAFIPLTIDDYRNRARSLYARLYT